MQQALERQVNPLAEAEQVRAEAKLIEAQGKAGIEAAKITENVRQFDTKTAQDSRQFQEKLALDLTKLEVDSGQDIPGSTV